MHVMEMTDDGPGRRAWCLVLERDEEAVERLEEFARKREVRAGHLTALGAFREATLAYFDTGRKEYDEIPVDGQAEVASLVGDVARTEEDEVVVHIHCVLGLPGGEARAGHLMEGRVRPTLEVFLEEGTGELTRRPDEETGLDLIRP